MCKIRADYPYNKQHTPQTFTAIMKHLAAANEACDLRKAKSPGGMANAVEEGLNYLGALVSQNEETSTYGEAYAATSDSESSYEKSGADRRCVHLAVAIEISFSFPIASTPQSHTPSLHKNKKRRESGQSKMQTLQKGWTHDTPSLRAGEKMQLEQEVSGMAAGMGLFQVEDTV